MCDICDNNGFIPINETTDYSGLEISINKKGLIRCRAYMHKEIFETQDIAIIKYCPMCGRRLGDD